VDTRIVPIADSHELKDRSFVAVIQDAKAVTQVTVSFSLTWPALEQRELTAASVGYRSGQFCDSGGGSTAVP